MQVQYAVVTLLITVDYMDEVGGAIREHQKLLLPAFELDDSFINGQRLQNVVNRPEHLMRVRPFADRSGFQDPQGPAGDNAIGPNLAPGLAR